MIPRLSGVAADSGVRGDMGLEYGEGTEESIAGEAEDNGWEGGGAVGGGIRELGGAEPCPGVGTDNCC